MGHGGGTPTTTRFPGARSSPESSRMPTPQSYGVPAPNPSMVHLVRKGQPRFIYGAEFPHHDLHVCSCVEVEDRSAIARAMSDGPELLMAHDPSWMHQCVPLLDRSPCTHRPCVNLRRAVAAQGIGTPMRSGRHEIGCPAVKTNTDCQFSGDTSRARSPSESASIRAPRAVMAPSTSSSSEPSRGSLDVYRGSGQVLEIKSLLKKRLTEGCLRHVRGAVEEVVRALDA